jgi:hypothetical protein
MVTESTKAKGPEGGESETRLLDPPKGAFMTAGACEEIIRGNADPLLRRHAALYLLTLIEGGSEADEAGIKELKSREKDLSVRNTLARVLNKLGFRKLLGQDPAAYYDRKLSLEEELRLQEEIKGLKTVYDKSKNKPGAFDEKYTVLDREIGKGGMARILKGVRRSDGKAVAFKYLMLEKLSRYASRDTLTALFLNEGRLLSERLDHPNVIKGFDYGVAEGEYFIVLEYIEGGSLHDLIGKGTLDPEMFREIGQRILAALEYVHKEGVVHRDINPKNILVGNAPEEVKLIDFGLALDKRGGFIPPPAFRGYNAAYTSPEQKANFNDVDERDDIYSLGVVFYEMLGGRVDDGEIHLEALAAYPETMRQAVGRCVEKERDKRWKNTGEVRRGLFGTA